MIMDMIICLAATILLFIIMFIGRKNAIDRWQGAMFFVLYGIYITYLILR
jgi:cation:H+ antiporter